MKNSHYKLIFGALTTFAAIASSPAQATFNWNSFSCTSGTCTGTSNGNGITATGWSTESEVGSWKYINGHWTQESNVSNKLEKVDLVAWSGGTNLGVDNPSESGSPNHSTDNEVNFDSVLFSFDNAVALTSVTMGWVESDADFSLLRYVGNGLGSPEDLSNKTYAQLTATDGWELVGNYNSLAGGYDYQTANVNGSGVHYSGSNIIGDLTKTSSLWLVAAMNGTWGTTDTKDDHFKIKALTGYIPYTPSPVPGVPEPSTLALMSVSFLAFGFTQRRRRKINLSPKM